MLRASEYIPPPACADAPSRVLRGHDLEFLHEGHPCSVWEASGVALQLRESKADQFGRGQVRIQHATGDVLCPVGTPLAKERQRPQDTAATRINEFVAGLGKGGLSNASVLKAPAG